MSGEPQTEAGRALLDHNGWHHRTSDLRYLVLAIEAEAIAQERERLAAAVRALGIYRKPTVRLDALLALLEGADR